MLVRSEQHAGSGNGHETVIGNDNEIGLGNDPPLIDRFSGCADIGKDGGSAALGTIARSVLDLESLVKEGGAEDPACRFYALAPRP
jgi:hypothetical protein